MSNLLIKETPLGFEKIFPKNYILNLKDKDSGKLLSEILKSFNVLFLTYTGNKSDTRKLVPMSLRHVGLWITYIIDKTVITEWYNSTDISDTTWGSDANWREGSNMLVGDISISKQGTWVINGEDTGISPQGPKGDSPIIRIFNNRILVSYDKGISYRDLNNTPVYTQFRFNADTNTHLVSYDLGKTWQDIFPDKVYYKFKYNESTNTYQVSTDFGKTWSNVSAEKVIYKFRYNPETNTHQVSTDLGKNWIDISNEKVFYKFRTNENKLQVSTDLGSSWEDCSEYIAAWFKWVDTSGTGNVGKILISRDNSTWSDLSPNFTNNLYIKGYVATVGDLPTSIANIGDIYMVGPTYDEGDETQDYPHYRMWVKQSSGWVDNGEYLSTVLISLTTGLEIGITMSLKAITEAIQQETERAMKVEGNKVDGTYEENPEFIHVVKDNNNNILGIIKDNGYNYIPKLLVDLLNVNGKEINGDAISSINYDDNPEYVHVVKDNAHNLIFAINNNGDIYPLKCFFDKINLSLKSNENKISETEGKITHIETEIQTLKNNVPDLITSSIYPLISAIIPTVQCISFYAENNMLFIGSSDGKIYKYDISVESNPVYLGSTTGLAIKGSVRSIVSNGDYIYATLRGNGSGMDNDYKYPLFLASFELGLTDMSQNHDSFDAYIKTGDSYIDETGDPCPSRWLHSAKLYKGEGSSFAKLIKNQEISEEAYISLWFRSDNTLNGNVYIPVIFNNNSDVVSFVISEDNKIGVSIGETMYISDIVIDNEWKNIKLAYKGNTIKVYIRNKECNSIWTEVVSVDGVTLAANQIGIGINSVSNNVTVYVDEYCYDTNDLDLTTNINGVVSIIRKSDLSIVNEYKLNMRGCSSYIHENYLFVGMIGGLNIYDISTGDSAELVGFNRDSSKKINYPKGDAEYNIRVPMIEIQKMHMYNNDGRNYIVGGNDVRGIVIYDVTDIQNPILYKEVLDIPNVSAINNEGTTINYPQYIEWDVRCEYPYIYSTVAALHRYRKDLQLVDENDLVYGLKIRDISNIDNITSVIVRMNKDDYPDYIQSDGDSRPVSFCFVKNKIVMGNCNKGIAIFKKNGFESKYIKSMEMLYDTRIYHVQSTRDGRVLASDYVNGLKNVYILKGII